MIQNLFEFIEPTVRNQPDRTAIVTPHGETLSYRQLGEIIRCFAIRASRCGVSKGDRVTLHAVSMSQYICMVMALSELGAVHVRAADEDNANHKGVEVDHVVVDKKSGLRGPKVIAMDLAWPAGPDTDPPVDMPGFDSEEEVCLIMSTSGTTGRRKQLAFSLDLIREKIDEKFGTFGPLNQRILLHVAPTVPLGLQMALLILRSGGQIVMPGLTQADTLSTLVEGRADEILAAPAMYSAWVESLRAGKIKLESIKRAIITGSLASKSLIDSIQEYVCRNLINNYGISELGVCAFSRVDELGSIAGAVGRVARGMEVRVIDEQGNVLERGVAGRLEFRPGQGRRRVPYIGDTIASPDSEEAWFAPGDIGTVTPDGILCIGGRETELINTGGNKIAPAVVEDFVTKFFGDGAPVCAFGIPGPDGFDEVVVVASQKGASRLAELSRHIELTKLGLGRMHFLAIKSFPLNDFGKVDRLKLREMATTEIARQNSRRQF